MTIPKKNIVEKMKDAHIQCFIEMKSLSIIALLSTLSLTSSASAATEGVPQPSKNHLVTDTSSENKQKQVTPGILVTDYWFFYGNGKSPTGLRKIPRRRDMDIHLTKNKFFGANISFTHTKPSHGAIEVKFQLITPTSAQTFTDNQGQGFVSLSRDKKTVTVAYMESPLEDSEGQYWGIGPEDPLGAYELRVFVENVLVETYRFTIE